MTRFHDRIDGRWFLLGSHLTLLFLGMARYDLQRTWTQIGVGIGVGLAAEIAFARWVGKFAVVRWRERLLSSLSVSVGMLILTKSFAWYYYGLGAAVATASKYLIRRPDGRHVYNPTNFAIVFSYAWLPARLMVTYPDEYTLRLLPYLSVPVFGVFATALSDRWRVSASYLAGAVVAAAGAAALRDVSFTYLIAPELGVFGLIFLFLMITDPQTSPDAPGAQVLFGATVGVANILLRLGEVTYSNFVALFVIVTLVNLRWLLPEASGRGIAGLERAEASP